MYLPVRVSETETGFCFLSRNFAHFRIHATLTHQRVTRVFFPLPEPLIFVLASREDTKLELHHHA